MSALDIGIAIADLVAIALFILGLHDLNSPPTARRGNRLAMVGMFIALVAVLVQTLGVGWQAIVIGTVVGGAIGVYAALKVKMTAMPQMVALYNGAGGGAAALISTIELYVQANNPGGMDYVIAVSLVLSAIIGCVSFAGSIIAFLKLQELMTGRPITYPGQQVVNALLVLGIAGLAGWFVVSLGTVPLWALLRTARSGAAARRPLRAADRRRGYAGRHFAAQLVHRSGRRDHRLRTLEHAADHLRRARRRERYAAHRPDG